MTAPPWQSDFPREGSAEDRKLAHLTLKLNIPAAWVENPTPATALEMDVVACKAVRDAVETYRASWAAAATTPAPEPQTPPQAPPTVRTGASASASAPATNYEECLSCQ